MRHEKVIIDSGIGFISDLVEGKVHFEGYPLAGLDRSLAQPGGNFAGSRNITGENGREP